MNYRMFMGFVLGLIVAIPLQANVSLLHSVQNAATTRLSTTQSAATQVSATQCTQPAGTLQLAAGFASEQGRRRTMEDAHTIEQNQRFGFFAVYDGHGGDAVANKAGERFCKIVMNKLSQLRTVDQQSIGKVLRQAFQYMEQELRILRTKAGSTAVCALVDKDAHMLYIANLGDSRAVLGTVQNGKVTPTQLSTDHKATSPQEADRIEAAGGFVFHKRVYGTLAVSRALGDFELKGDAGSKLDIAMSEPEIRLKQLGPNDGFLILACDGVWDVMTNEKAATIVNNTLTRTYDPKQAAQTLVQDALKDPNQGDNVTTVIIEFKHKTS